MLANVQEKIVALKPIETDRLRQMLDKCVEESERSGLSVMTMDEINAEIKAYRAEKRAMRNAKSNYRHECIGF